MIEYLFARAAATKVAERPRARLEQRLDGRFTLTAMSRSPSLLLPGNDQFLISGYHLDRGALSQPFARLRPFFRGDLASRDIRCDQRAARCRYQNPIRDQTIEHFAAVGDCTEAKPKCIIYAGGSLFRRLGN
jgi:hypothetical protein